MIASISSGGGGRGGVLGALGYNDSKVENGEAQILKFANFDKCMTGPAAVVNDAEIPGSVINKIDTDDLIQLDTSDAAVLMQRQINLNTRVKNTVFSCSLNLNHEDLQNIEAKVSSNGCKDENELYRKIADDYMKGMGYGNQPYIVYKHNDIERTHIHIVSVRIDAEGKRISDSNEKWKSENVRARVNESFGLSTKGETKGRALSADDIQHTIQERQRFMGSINERIATSSQPAALMENSRLIKQNISKVLKYVDENYHPKNLTEYNKVLSQFNVVCKPCSKGEDSYGKGYSGCQFSVLKGDDEVVSHLIKGSAFGKKYSYQALEQKFAYNSGNENLRKVDGISKDYIRTAIDNYVKAPTKKDFDGLIQHLDERGITVNKVADLDDPTKIKGINFIDNVNGNTYNGSQLGKAYSYSRICESIEKKNAEIDKFEIAAEERIYLPKDIYVSGMKILNAAFNKERKDQKKYGCYFECDAIRKLDDFKQVLGQKVAEELSLNPKQTDKLFDSFKQNKLADLPNIELRESVGQKNNIVTAVQFAQNIPNYQKRANFFEQMGVKATATGEFDWKFSSKRMPNVSLTSAEIIILTKDSKMPVLDKNMLYSGDGKTPWEGMKPLTKEERGFIKDFVEGKDIKHIDSSVCGLANALDDKLAQPLLDKVFVPSETWKKVNDNLNNLKSEIVKEQYGYSTLSLINNFDKHKNQFYLSALKACGNDIIAEKMVGDFQRKLEQSRPAIVEKENTISKDRIIQVVQFAANKVETARQSEFFARMGVVVGQDKMGNFEFSTVRNPQYKMSVKDLRESCSNLPSILSYRLECTKPEHLKQVVEGSLYKFNTKAFEQVRLFNEGKLDERNYDFKNASALSYVRDYDSLEIKQLDISTRMREVVGRNLKASTSETVFALLSRGFVIKEIGSEFKIGKLDSNDSDFVDLPLTLSDSISKDYHLQREIKNLYPKDNYMNWKTILMSKVSNAGDKQNPQLLDSIIEDVKKKFPNLADGMSRARGSLAAPDYQCVAKVVMKFAGESYVVVPPPTRREDSFMPVYHEDVLNRGLQKVIDDIRTVTAQNAFHIKSTAREIPKSETFKGKSADGKPDFDGLCDKYNLKLTEADKDNLTKFGIMNHTVHTVIGGERDLVIGYDKQNNQFALANPQSFVINKNSIGGGMSDDTYKNLMKDGAVVFKDFKHKDGRINDALLYLNPFKMAVCGKDKIPDFTHQIVSDDKLKLEEGKQKVDPFIKPPVDNEQNPSRGFKRGL